MSVLGHGIANGILTPAEVARWTADALQSMPLDGRRVLVIIPDGTRTMPMPAMFELLETHAGPRVAALDYLVALGTHAPMSDADLSRLVGRPVIDGVVAGRRIFNHRWDDPSTFASLGEISARDVATITDGRLAQAIPVALNRLVLAYDHVLICGPVFPHEVAGFSGGTKYLFPGVAAPEIIHLTHWLGALITSYDVIGTIDTPVRAVIDRAASLVPTPMSLLALVVTHDGVAGVFGGEMQASWRRAATLSSQRHIVWVDEPYDRILAVMPRMYDDLWTAAKGMYKTEPAIADGGEVIIYAPHVHDVSVVHGRVLREIGYHCRDYFLGQWDRFGGYPGGILAHSTHVKGRGAYDERTRTETPRIDVTLATAISRGECDLVNLGYQDPAAIDPATWASRVDGRTLVVPHAGEHLYRVGKAPASDE